MAIATVNVTWLGLGPTKTGQILSDSEQRGDEAQKLYGYATYTGEGAQGASTAVLNYIDGTQALIFAPTAILFSRAGGSATATIVPTEIKDAGNSNKTASVTFSAAFAGTITIALVVFK